MEQDKLTSMKNVMAYQEEQERFPEKQAKLVKDIEQTKTANALIETTLDKLYADKSYLNELREAEEARRAEAEAEAEAAEE